MWSHKNYGSEKFKGTYERDKRNERVFVLVGKKNITFESWQAAKGLGWKLKN